MRRLAVALAVFIVSAASLLVVSAAASATERGDRGAEVTEIQTILHDFGYTVSVDGTFGPQTEKAVRSWQKSNGLQVDGVVGPATMASLRSATRLTNAHQVTGLNGLPFAPEGLSNCDEARFYRQQAGLPDAFDALIWRESNCKNTVTSPTGCCVGALQLHWINWRDHRTIPGLAACDATWANVKGDEPIAWQRQMCAAKVLFDVVGYTPWRLTT